MNFIPIFLLLHLQYAAGCPTNWIGIEEEGTCYKTVGERLSWGSALQRCNNMGANLLSLSHSSEFSSLTQRILALDKVKQDWWTSGSYSGVNWEWQEDGSLVTYDRWISNSTVPHTGHLILTPTSHGYKWKSSKPSARHGFICEIPMDHSWAILSSRRQQFTPFEYGWSSGKVIQKNRSPRLVIEPQSVTTHLGDNGPRRFIKLQCTALGYPIPQIRWFEDSGAQVQSDKNILKLGGTLLFLKVSKADFGSYYCTASNMYGTVRSKSASISVAYVNEFAANRMDTYVTEGEGFSIDCQEPEHFPRTYFFGWIYDSANKFVTETNRIFIARDGTLYFSYVRKEDAKKYACNMVNYRMHMGHYGPFFNLHVNSPPPLSSKKSRAPTIPENFLRIYPIQPELGKPVWIECFAYGRPSPEYSWDLVDGSPLPSGVNVRELKRVIYIASFDERHIGTYRCTASNSIATTSKQIRLTFNSAPELVAPMEDTFVVPNDTFVLECNVYAEPLAHFEWFRNGKPLSPLLLPPGDQARISIRKERLTVKFARKHDSGVYECIASNELGELSDTASVSIRAFAPNFSKTPRLSIIYASVDDHVVLPCPTESSPSPQYSWKKNGKSLQYDASKSLAFNGSLAIGGVELSDKGQYQCLASNTHGFSEGYVKLNVWDSLKLNLNPDLETIRLEHGDNMSIVCSLDAIKCEKCPEVSYSWTFNDFSLSDVTQYARFVPVSEIEKSGATSSSMLSLTNVTNLHSGTLICRADTLAGHTSRAVRILVPSIALSPVQLTANNDDPTKIKLSWRMASNNDGGVDSYRIEAVSLNSDTRKRKEEWFIIEEELKSHHPVIDEFVVDQDKLIPFTFYQFRVKAHNSVGWGIPSGNSDSIRTKKTRPKTYPQDLTTFVYHQGEIVLFWNPISMQEWHSDTLGYKIKWKPKDSENEDVMGLTSGVTSSLHKIDDPNSDHLVVQLNSTISTSRHCSQFSFRIRAFNDIGDGPWSKPVMAYIGSGELKGAVRVISAEPVNSTHASFSWHWIPESGSLCDSTALRGFKLMCSAKNVPSKFPVISVIPFDSYASSERLHGNHALLYTTVVGSFDSALLYECDVLAYAQGQYKSVSSNKFNILLGMQAPMNPPSSLDVESRDGYSVRLTWRPPQSSDSGVSPSGYRVSVLPEVSWSQPILLDIDSSQLYNPGRPDVFVNGLISNMQYTIQVAAYGPGGVGPKSDKSTFRFGSGNRAMAFSSQIIVVVPLTLAVLFYNSLCK